MALVLNSFPVEVAPPEALLPCIDYKTWEESTKAKEHEFPDALTWRYEMDDDEAKDGGKRIRLVFLAGPSPPPAGTQGSFDLGRFWRIGCLLIEGALVAHFAKRGFSVEESHFERLALRRIGSPDEAVDLAVGVSYSARRPFRDERYRFTLSFQWVVRALFKDALTNKSLSAIALGMPVLYMPNAAAEPELRQFKNHYLGRVRNIDPARGLAVINCRDERPRSVPLADLRLEASPAVIKQYERRVRARMGPSLILRTIQQLKLSLTKENRRNLTALRDRLEQIRRLLYEVGSSRDQLVIPLASFQTGSVSVSLSPVEATPGDSW